MLRRKTKAEMTMMTMMTKSRDDLVNHDDWSREDYIEDDEGSITYFFSNLPENY